MTGLRICLVRLRRNRGEMYIDTVISVFVIMVFMALVMAFLPVFMQKYQLDMAAQDIARGISVSGVIAVQDADVLSQEYGMTIDRIEVVPSGDARLMASAAGQRIQLSDSFTVTIYSHREVGVGGITGPASVSISSTARGRSEVFWKEMAVEV